MGRAAARIVIGALVGGGLGLLLGLLMGAANLFVYVDIGIAVGAGAFLAFGSF